jgi:hypothetical protein
VLGFGQCGAEAGVNRVSVAEMRGGARKEMYCHVGVPTHLYFTCILNVHYRHRYTSFPPVLVLHFTLYFTPHEHKRFFHCT